MLLNKNNNNNNKFIYIYKFKFYLNPKISVISKITNSNREQLPANTNEKSILTKLFLTS